MTLSPNYVTLAPGESTTVTLNSDGVAVDAASVTWTSNAPEVFTIENGTITAIKVGKGTFTATYNNSSVTGDVEVSEVAPTVPTIEPVEGGITIAIYVPDNSTCKGSPLWGGEDNGWNGAEMTAVEGAERWYKVDIAATTALGKPLANFEGWENGLGNWDSQWGDYEVLSETTVSYTISSDGNENLQISEAGIAYIWVKSWKKNPCVADREYKFTLVLPECTPEGTETVYVCGSFPDADGNTWAKGTGFPVVDGKAEVTLTGQDNMGYKARLSADTWDQGEKTLDTTKGCVAEITNRTFGASEGQEVVIEGWNGVEGCFEGYELCP